MTETPIFDPDVSSALRGSLSVNVSARVFVRFQFRVQEVHTSVLKPAILPDVVCSFLNFFKINAEILGF